MEHLSKVLLKDLDQLKESMGEMTYNDLEFVLNCLKEVLEESGNQDLVKFIPWIKI